MQSVVCQCLPDENARGAGPGYRPRVYIVLVVRNGEISSLRPVVPRQITFAGEISYSIHRTLWIALSFA